MECLKRPVTYDEDASRGYIYFCDPGKYKIIYTQELSENDDIIIDFGKDIPIIGIELEGKTAKKLKYLADKEITFNKAINKVGKICYSFRLNNTLIRNSITHPDVETIVFHFTDIDCKDFVGIDIFDEKYITSNN